MHRGAYPANPYTGCIAYVSKVRETVIVRREWGS